jgi:hypothetical protein
MGWTKIKQNENYSINELGEVRNDRTGVIKKPYCNKRNGYLYVDLYKDNKAKKTPVHRLLAEAFIPNPYNKPTVDHKDRNRANNSLNNLRWATYNEQNSRFNEVGVRSQKVKVSHYREERNKRGGGHVRWLNVDMVLYFDRIGDAAEHFDTTIGNISLMLKNGNIGRRGKMRGYKFEYLDSQRITIL